LVQRAAGIAEDNSRKALDMAQAFASATRRGRPDRGVGGGSYCISGQG
jgi:hypothetical protein